MPRKKRARDDNGEFIADDPSTPENEAWEPDTVKMTRPDKGEIDVPVDQVERYKASSWKLV